MSDTSTVTISAQEHLNEATERALVRYDSGEKMKAIRGFISDMREHEGTRHIPPYPLGVPTLLREADQGRDAFKAAMLGFSV